MTNQQGLISIIVPIYNCQQYLVRCVNSLLQQSYQNIEVILIDDGSSDDSGQLCQQFASQDKRVVFIQQKNSGVSVARNKGMEVASGEYLAFCDSDDWVDENMYANLQKELFDKQTDAVFCGYYKSLEDGSETKATPLEEGIVDNQKALCQILGITTGIQYGTSPWNKLFKRELLKGFRFDKNYAVAEDALFLVQVFKQKCKVYLDPSSYYHYYIRTGSAYRTKGVTVQRYQEVFAWQKIAQELNNEYPVQYERTIFITYCCGFNLMRDAYVAKDKEIYEAMVKTISPYQALWKASKYNTFTRIMKTRLLCFLMSHHFPVWLIKLIVKIRK